MSRPERGAAEYSTLSDLLRNVGSHCITDDRFTQERELLSDTDVKEMRQACSQCPAVSACGAYANIARPSAGMWAGRFWGRRERTITEREEP
jgi:hypothetical protein